MRDEGNDVNQDEAQVEDYLDEALTGNELSRFEERMQTDLVLRRRVAELRSLRQDLEALPRDASVPDRVWDGILAQIQDGSPVEGDADQGSDIIALSSAASVTGGPAQAPLQRQFSFSIPQLAAAAIVLVSLGGVLTWSMSATPPSVAVTTPLGTVSQVATVDADDPVQTLFAEYEASSAALMEIVNDGASVLSDETVAIVRESVNAIDQAVREAREALKQDPGSEMLNRILLSNMQKKLDLLRSTAAAVQSMA
ncbi:MAG: hypothetical protein ACR2P5_07750 [Gammaproteobacteria bacterium]